MQPEKPRAIILMGVSGAGKTTIGRALARRLNWRFFEGDDYHPLENVRKMAAGQPLTDADRRPWLDRLNGLLRVRLAKDEPLLLACSALKGTYRDRLRAGVSGVAFVFLRGQPELIAERLRRRSGHYMPPDLLESQFKALEQPQEALVVDVDRTPGEIVDSICRQLGLACEQ